MDDSDWESIVGLVDALSATVVEYYTNNEVTDRKAGLEAMIILAHLTMTHLEGPDYDFNAFVANCVAMSKEIKASRIDDGLKN